MAAQTGRNIAKKAAADEGPSILSVFHTLRKNWPIIVACTLMAGGAALLFSKTLPFLYEANAMLEFDPNAVRPLAKETDPMRGWSSYWDNKENYETQYHVIVSESVLSSVARDLALATDPKFLGLKEAPATPRPMEEVTAMIRGRVKIDPVKNSRLFMVRVEDNDPKRARSLCDSIVRTYIAQNLEKSIVQSSDAALWLNGQVDHYKGELETNENSLHDFKAKNELPSSTLEEVSKMIRMEMEQYDQALTHTRTRRQELTARNAELTNAVSSSAEILPDSELLNNGFLSELRKQFQTAQKERLELLTSGKGENHPQVRALDEKIATIRQEMLEEVKNIQGSVERDLAIMDRQEKGEAALYEAARRRAVELNMKELEYHRIDRTRLQNEKLYDILLERMKEADLARMMNVNNVRLVDAPLEPKAPFSPKIPLNVGIGVLAGLVIGIALALIRERLDSSIKTPDDVEQKLGVTFLGLLPEVDDDQPLGATKGKKRRTGRSTITPMVLPPELIVHERPLSGIAEAARTLRTNLMFMNPDKPHRKLLVTSAAPAEGKTTVATSIAISLAQSGQKVCIVDCDLRRPRLHRIFDRAGEAGLTNVLVGEATLDEVAQPTMIDNLWCVPSGPIPPNPADTLHSERFRQFISDLGDRFDRVVIDSPPLVAVTDSAIISTLVDGVVFVIRAFTTTAALAKQGLRSLSDVDAPIAGAVLNAVNLKKHEYDYYQYYYYRREGYAPLTPVAATDKRSDDSSPTPPN